MNTLHQSYNSFRFLVRSLRWVELAASCMIVFVARAVAHLEFEILPVSMVFALGFLWNAGFWYAGRRHLLRERGLEGQRLLIWSWVISDVVIHLLIIMFTGLTSSPFLFLLGMPVALSTVALRRAIPSYGVALGTTAGLGALWAMDRAGSIPDYRSYPSGSADLFLQPDVAAGVMLMTGAVLCLLVYSVFRRGPQFAMFQESFREGRFRIQGFQGGSFQELRLEEVESIGPEDLLEEVVGNLTTNPAVVFGAAIVFPTDSELNGGPSEGSQFHHNKHQHRVVSIVRGQVIPTWSEYDFGQSELFRSLRVAEGGDLWEGPFSLLHVDGLFQRNGDAEYYVATPVSEDGRTVVVLLAGLQRPDRDRGEVVLHLLNVASQLKPLFIAERRLSKLRGELSALHDENESLSRVNKMQNDFVSIASHELKTPLTAIGAYTDALMGNVDRPDFTETKPFLKVIRLEADRLLRMVNRILDFSQIEFGHRSPRRQPVQLTELVEECLTTMRPQLEDNGIRTVMELSEQLPRVEVDRDLMKQVFLNLLSNAAKFSSHGDRIFVTAVEGATTIDVSVRDEGPGIPPDEVDNVFKQFYRVPDEDGERAEEGSGLGLTIVRNIVEQHAGRITVDGGEGIGATFTFSIPKEQCINDQPETVLGDLTQRGEFASLMKLLVQMIADYMECKIVSVMLLSRDRKELFVQVAYGLDRSIVQGARVAVGTGIAGRVAVSGKPLLIENVEELEGQEGENNPQYETSSLISVPLTIKGQVVGVINCNNKVTGRPFGSEDLGLLMVLTEKVAQALSRAVKYEDSRESLQQTVGALQALVDLHASGGKSTRRAVRIAMQVGQRLGMTRQQLLGLQYACVVHDVGMISVDAKIREKSGPLSDQEKDVMREHALEGIDLIAPFLEKGELDDVIRYHHERVDGGGYPHGLAGDHIPLAARVVAVVDAYDAMTSPRPYRRALDPLAAAQEIVEHSGTQFDTDVVRSFLAVLAENGEIAEEQVDVLSEEERWLRPASLS